MTSDTTGVTDSVQLSNGTNTSRPAVDTYICLDADECASSPCKNGASCTDSLSDSKVFWTAYKCTCVAGYTNGAIPTASYLRYA